jgi:uncharacterized protein YcfJ
MKKVILGAIAGALTSTAAYAVDTSIQVPVDHVEPVYESQQQITGTNTVCNNVIVRGTDNTVVGTIIGGVIGSQVDKSNRAVGAVIGSVIGGSIGGKHGTPDRIEQRCSNQPIYETKQRFRYYNVYYSINGNTHMTKMHVKPKGSLTVHLYPNLYVEGGF